MSHWNNQRKLTLMVKATSSVYIFRHTAEKGAAKTDDSSKNVGKENIKGQKEGKKPGAKLERSRVK